MAEHIETQVPCKGYDITADWYESESDNIVLVLPGYMSRKERQVDLASAIAVKGANVLVADLSGHGTSQIPLEATTPAQHLMETVCTLDMLAKEHPGKRVSVMGTSYGAFLAAYASRFRDFHRLLLRTPAIYRPQDLYTSSTVIDRKYTAEVYRHDITVVSQHPLFRQEPVFTGETLVVVHAEDEDVPQATSDVYVQAFDAQSFVVPGFRHSSHDPANPPGDMDAYRDRIAAWLNA